MLIPRTIICASLIIGMLSSACEGDHEPSTSTELLPTETVAAAVSNPAKSDSMRQTVALARPSAVGANTSPSAPLIRYQSPLETGRHNVTKEKADKAFVASPPAPIAAKLDGAEQRRRTSQYLAQWEQQKGHYNSLSEDEKEAIKGQLKRQMLGEQP